MKYCPIWDLLNGDQLDIKDQRCVGGDQAATCTSAAISQSAGDDQCPLAAHFHACKPFIPALNHLTCAEEEIKWLVTIQTAIKLFAFMAFSRCVV